MMMVSKIVAGDYEGCGIHYHKAWGQETFELQSKPSVGGKSIGVNVSKSTIASIEVGGSVNDFRAGQAVAGAVLFGAIGLLAGGNNQRYSVIINWKDGKRSLCDLNKQEYDALQKVMF